MRPKWEKVGQFLWRTPVRGGWLYNDIRDRVTYYESDPDRERENFMWRFGDQSISLGHQPIVQATGD